MDWMDGLDGLDGWINGWDWIGWMDGWIECVGKLKILELVNHGIKCTE